MPGAKNEVNPFQYADARAARQANAATLTFDQRLMPGLKVYGEAFYLNRRGYGRESTQQCNYCLRTYAVPTSNPYYPVGAPAGLQVSASSFLTIRRISVPTKCRRATISACKRTCLSIGRAAPTTPTTWTTPLRNFAGEPHPQTISAALGNTNKATGGFEAYTKPANLPYFNPFCDPTANSCVTQGQIDYMLGWRNQGPALVQHQREGRQSGRPAVRFARRASQGGGRGALRPLRH